MIEVTSNAKRVVLYSARHVVRQWPANMQPQDAGFFSTNREVQLSASYALHLHGVSLLTDGVVFQGLRIYAETFVGPAFRVHNWRGLVYIYLKLPTVVLPRGRRYLLAHDAWAHNYYHWLADTLPRLFAVREQLADLTLLLPANYTSPFIEETLRAFGVVHIERLEQNVRYWVPDLLVPLRLAPLANYRPEAMQALAAFLRSQFPVLPDVTCGERVYISRSRAPRRKIINEEEVVAVLQEKGFAIVHFEDYTFQQQVSIAAQARYLVSIHGAGLTNMLFMPPNGRVLELQMRDDGTNCYYYTMADALGLGYYYQFCTPNDSSLSVQDADLMVDLTELAANIDVLLQE